MKRAINITILSIAAIVVGAVAAISYLNNQKQIKIGSVSWKTTDRQKIALLTKEKGVFHLDLSLTGNLKSTEALTILVMADTLMTVPPKEYTIQPGSFEVKYNGDWYLPECYVQFTPPAGSEGKLEVQADFVGH